MVAEPVALLGLLGGDGHVAARLARLATALGGTLRQEPVGLPPDRWGPPPRCLVVDLDAEGGQEALVAWRAAYPALVLLGYLGTPDQRRWVAAQRAGADRVSSRGTVARVAEEALGAAAAGPRVYPLCDEADVAGHLGLVVALPDSPVGPVALFQVDGQLCAVADRCPHAAATLSGGELEGRVLTCPAHGSRFDVVTGERVRGPADADLPTYRVLVQGGQVGLVRPAGVDG